MLRDCGNKLNKHIEILNLTLLELQHHTCHIMRLEC